MSADVVEAVLLRLNPSVDNELLRKWASVMNRIELARPDLKQAGAVFLMRYAGASTGLIPLLQIRAPAKISPWKKYRVAKGSASGNV